MNNVKGRPRPVQMGYEKWSKISADKKVAWNEISDKSKRIILGSSQGTSNQDPASYRPLAHRLMPPSHRKTNAHYLSKDDVNEYVDARVHQILAKNHKIGDETPAEVQKDSSTDQQNVLALAANRFSQSSGTNLHQADPRRLMSSNTSNSPTSNSITVNGVTYYAKFHLTYIVNASRRISNASLIDRGANGGICGEDVRIINGSSDRKVSI